MAVLPIFCKIIDGEIVKRERKQNPISKIIDGKPVWRELIMAGERPAYDSATHHKPVMIEAIEPTQVVQSWQPAVAKTQAELDAEIQAAQDSAISRAERPNSFEAVLFKISFLQENRIRALEGQLPITAAQFKTWARGQF